MLTSLTVSALSTSNADICWHTKQSDGWIMAILSMLEVLVHEARMWKNQNFNLTAALHEKSKANFMVNHPIDVGTIH